MFQFQEILFVLSPLIFAAIMVATLSKIKSLGIWSKALAPTFFLAVSLHFALFANLLASELWNDVVKANQAIRNEVSGLRSMMNIAEASLGNCSVQIVDSVKFYIDEVRNHEFEKNGEPHARTNAFPLSKLYRLLDSDPEFIPNEALRSLFKDSLEQVRFNHYERISLKVDHVNVIKLGALFVFGLLTLVAIGVYHAGSRPALIFTTTLFSICFSLTLLVMIILDTPYRYPYLVSPDAFDDVSIEPFRIPED